MKENKMTYRVHHVFPETGEWSQLEVDTLCEALACWKCKTSTACLEPRVVTVYDQNDRVLTRASNV